MQGILEPSKIINGSGRSIAGISPSISTSSSSSSSSLDNKRSGGSSGNNSSGGSSESNSNPNSDDELALTLELWGEVLRNSSEITRSATIVLESSYEYNQDPHRGMFQGLSVPSLENGEYITYIKKRAFELEQTVLRLKDLATRSNPNNPNNNNINNNNNNNNINNNTNTGYTSTLQLPNRPSIQLVNNNNNNMNNNISFSNIGHPFDIKRLYQTQDNASGTTSSNTSFVVSSPANITATEQSSSKREGKGGGSKKNTKRRRSAPESQDYEVGSFSYTTGATSNTTTTSSPRKRSKKLNNSTQGSSDSSFDQMIFNDDESVDDEQGRSKSSGKKRKKAVDKSHRVCHHCNTRETPEWRRGPAGSNTLCNACGLKYAKNVRKAKEKNKSSKSSQSSPPVSSNTNTNTATTTNTIHNNSNNTNITSNLNSVFGPSSGSSMMSPLGPLSQNLPFPSGISNFGVYSSNNNNNPFRTDTSGVGGGPLVGQSTSLSSALELTTSSNHHLQLPSPITSSSQANGVGGGPPNLDIFNSFHNYAFPYAHNPNRTHPS